MMGAAVFRRWRAGLTAGAVTLLVVAVLPACSSKPKAVQPQALPANPGQLQLQMQWQHSAGSQSGASGAALQMRGAALAISNAAGGLQLVDAQGQVRAQAQLGQAAVGPAGSDGQYLAAVDAGSRLQVHHAGKLLWQQRLHAQSYTAPVVAGERVFVLLADRSVVAYDANNGAKLWQQQKASSVLDTLALREAGVLMPFGHVLLAGIGAHLQAIHPDNGQVLWDKTVATPRSTNDVERLADLVYPADRQGDSVCVRAYQTGLACVDAALGTLTWARKGNGSVGLGGTAQQVFAVEQDGKILGLNRADGSVQWTNSNFLRRQLTAAVAVGDWVAVGDRQTGYLYWLNAADGQLRSYSAVATGGIASLHGLADSVLVLSHSGQLTAYRVQAR